MKKLGFVLHALGMVSGITGAFILKGYGWHVYQWPLISCMWILVSFINLLTIERMERNERLMDVTHDNLHEQLVKTQTELLKERLGKK
jgi:hypothetical protein